MFLFLKKRYGANISAQATIQLHAYRQGLLECPPDNLVQLHQESLDFQKETKASLNTLQFQCQAVRNDVSVMRSLQWVLAFSEGRFEAGFCFGPST